MSDDEREEKELDLSSSEVVTKYKTAAEMVNKALKLVVSDCKPKAKIVDICEKGDSFIRESSPMASSTKRLARLICSIAFSIYFIIIIFQVPIFSVPYRKGICKTPLEVITASEVFPRFIVKALLYPGAVANAIWKHKSIPSYKNLLKLYNFNTRTISAASNLQCLEVLVGSYIAVGGAINGLIKPGRMGFFGILLLMWGLIKELIMGKSTWGIQIYPAMYIALISAFFSIRKDVRRLIHSFTRKHRKEKGF